MSSPASQLAKTVGQIWKDRLRAALPPEAEVAARNRFITGSYARWYTTYPEIFKWAGVASFASHRVGLALMPYTFATSFDQVVGLDPQHHSLVGGDQLFRDLNHIRVTNTHVYENIGWAHMAYVSPDGGLAAIEAELDGVADQELLLNGFRMIDAGRQLLKSEKTRKHGEDLIFQGNVLLTRHEQFVIIQPQMATCDPCFDLFLTFATAMSFEANELKVVWHHYTSFDFTMWTIGIPEVIRTRKLPDFACVEHRWFWVTNRVLPTWKRLEATDPCIKRSLQIFMDQAPPGPMAAQAAAEGAGA